MSSIITYFSKSFLKIYINALIGINNVKFLYFSIHMISMYKEILQTYQDLAYRVQLYSYTLILQFLLGSF